MESILSCDLESLSCSLTLCLCLSPSLSHTHRHTIFKPNEGLMNLFWHLGLDTKRTPSGLCWMEGWGRGRQMTFETSINTQVPNKANSISFACEKLCTRFRPPTYVVKCRSALCKQVCTYVWVWESTSAYTHTHTHRGHYCPLKAEKDFGISH